jgi:hypothetical protein
MQVIFYTVLLILVIVLYMYGVKGATIEPGCSCSSTGTSQRNPLPIKRSQQLNVYFLLAQRSVSHVQREAEVAWNIKKAS